MRVPTADQFAGCLIGQALGDALGFPVEGRPPATCAAYVSDMLQAGRAGSLGCPPFPFGQYTDDTQLARELLASYVARRGFDPADFARRIAAMFTHNRIVGRGRATEAAALRLARGVPWQQAGTPAPNAGNGGAMRAGPVGLMFWDDAEALVAAARDQALITHADPRSAAGAVAIAGAVGLALTGQLQPPARVVETLAAWSETVDRSFAGELRRLDRWRTLAPAAAAPEIADAGLQPGFSDRWQGISPFVTSSVIWSLYSVLNAPGDYWQCICLAIAVGGDVDTTAAMAGAISGAAVGLAALPADLATRLNDQGEWDFEALRALALQAYRVKVGE